MHSPPRVSLDEVRSLKHRLRRSYQRLFTHPVIVESPVIENMPPPILPNGMLKSLFNDVVHREFNIDPNPSGSHLLCRSYLERNRRVAPQPSLSSPFLLTNLSSGFNPEILSDKTVFDKVAPSPLQPLTPTISAIAVHEILERRRLERAERAAASRLSASKLKTQANNDKTDEPVSEQLSPTNNADDLESVRQTRAAARRGNRKACCFCPPHEAESTGSDKKSELLGPFANLKSVTGSSLYVHFECACWAPQVFTDPATSQLRRVYEEYCRGRLLKCAHCGARGATVGCYVQRCKKVFHFRCLGPGGARRVDRFFVAFCGCHGHLADESSYKTLMEAATIADVAAAQRKDDVTNGLDAPHSRFTKLRRSETEVIFSSVWGVTSTSSAFDSTSVVFSHRRRVVLRRHDTFSPYDCLRAVRLSALDVASGRLAYMSVVGQNGLPVEMSSVEARAALASRDNTGIFLLRNLRCAPRWTKQQLRLVKSSSHWGKNSQTGEQKPNPFSGPVLQPRSDLDPSFFQGRYDGDGEPLLIVNPPSDASKLLGDASEPPGDTFNPSSDGLELPDGSIKAPDDNLSKANVKRRGRPRKGRQSPNFSTEENTKEVDDKQDSELTQHEKSLPLPAFKKPRKIGGNREAEIPPDELVTSIQDHIDGNINTPTDSTRKSSLPSQRDIDALREEHPVAGLKGKVKSAWETFLNSELPKERILRPDDSMEDSMRNMARLWSLMPSRQRKEYEERARRAASLQAEENETLIGGDASGLDAFFEQSRRRGRQTMNEIRPQRVGLFASGNIVPTPVKSVAHSGKRQSSVSLPSNDRYSSRRTRRNHGRGEPVDLDAMFPELDLDDEPIEDHPVSKFRNSIRSPPVRKRRRREEE